MESLIRQVVGESYRNNQLTIRTIKGSEESGLADGARRNSRIANKSEEEKKNKEEAREEETKRREQETDRRSREGSIREEENSNPGTETRRKIKLVARPDDSPKNKILARQNAIQTNVIDEGKPFMFNDNKFGLSASLINAARAIVEGEVRKIDGGGETPVKVNPSLDMNTEEEKPTRSDRARAKKPRETVDESLNDGHKHAYGTHEGSHEEAVDQLKKHMESRGWRHVKSEQHGGGNLSTHQFERTGLGGKSRAVGTVSSIGNGSGKRKPTWDVHTVQGTHGVREEVEQIDELKKSTLASYAKKAVSDIATRTHDLAKAPGILSKDAAYMDRYQKFNNKTQKRKDMIGKAVDKLAKEEFTDEEIEHLDYIASTLDETLDEARKKSDASSKAPSKAQSKPKKVKTLKAGPKAKEQAPEPEPSTSTWGKPLSQDEVSASIAKRYAGLKDNLKNAGWNHSGTQPTREGKTHTFTGMAKQQYGNLGNLHNALKASGFTKSGGLSPGSHMYKHNNGSTIHVVVAPHSSGSGYSVGLKHHEPKTLHEEDMSEVFDSGHHTGYHGLSPKQMKIAGIAGNPREIDSKDLKALRLRAAKKKNK